MNEKGLLQQTYDAIPRQAKTAFFSCVIVGFLTHLFAFTNIIPNSDGLSRIFDEQQMTISGRWFLHYASMFHGYVQAPALIGALSLLFLGLAAGMTADVLKLRSPLASALCGAMLAVFPAVAYTYLYMFTASAYAFAISLAVLSVWITRNYPKFFPLAAIFLACAVGTYQAYFAVAASLALSCVILDLLDGKVPVKKIIREGIRTLGMLALGAVAYYVILRVFLFVKDLELLSYRGIDSVGSGLSLGGIVGMVIDTYRSFLYFFLIPGSSRYNTQVLVVMHLVLMAAAILSALTPAAQNKLYRQPLRVSLLVVGCGLLPLACNFTQLLSESTAIMRYAFAFAYVLAIALVDRLPQTQSRLGKPLKIASCAAAMVILLLFAQISNIAYTASATAHRATERFSTNLVGRVEATEGYENGMEVVIIGTFPDDVYYSDIEAFELVEHYSCMSSSVMQLNKHVYYYLNDWLNVPWQEPDEETFLSVSQSDVFQSMPLYPSDGSVLIIDGKVVVKLAEEYIPKQDYEIAYDERK